MRQQSIQFANFVCKFGNKNLLDYLFEIVLPAFTDRALVRNYGERASYVFHNVTVSAMISPENRLTWTIAGQFVKNTELQREQILDDSNGLIKDHRTLRSSPSSFFVLVLNNNRLMYYPETAHAPDFTAFRATCMAFLDKKHKDFINSIYLSRRIDKSKLVTKRQLYNEHKSLHLEIVPLVSQDNVQDFINRFNKLQNIVFKIIRPNDDISAAEILGEIRQLSDELGSENAKLTIRNSTGLNKDVATSTVISATESGNQEVMISGIDEDGNRLSGSNEKFNLTSPIETFPTTTGSRISMFIGKFLKLQKDGKIIAPPVDHPHPNLEQLKRSL